MKSNRINAFHSESEDVERSLNLPRPSSPDLRKFRTMSTDLRLATSKHILGMQLRALTREELQHGVKIKSFSRIRPLFTREREDGAQCVVRAVSSSEVY